MAAEAAAADSGHLILFDLEKADVRTQVNFASPFWPLVHNIPMLYSELLTRMREFGVDSHTIRTDAGDGSLGAYNVNFGLLNSQSMVRIRLENAEFQCLDLGLDNWTGKRALSCN